MVVVEAKAPSVPIVIKFVPEPVGSVVPMLIVLPPAAVAAPVPILIVSTTAEVPPAIVVVRAAVGAMLPRPIVVALVLLPIANTPAPAIPTPDIMLTVVFAADAPLAIETV